MGKHPAEVLPTSTNSMGGELEDEVYTRYSILDRRGTQRQSSPSGTVEKV
ncbi:MAG: hypothetical protein KIH08_13440 [Candidatus Freyarchaeota archaeon]|nr:hypothetical protein [Candidatus Jordarchaeia archaeon]MBS7270040.1 hypothetical protein [Candidatus Jordarchaeia archaeon]MBS7280494.1 hypothetical protein [Candidatus Jordarchaeia archaeon]